MATTQENKELVERGFESFAEENLDRIDELMADDYVLHDPTVPEEIRGRDAFKEYLQSYRTAFPDMTVTIDSMVAENDLVAVRFRVRGTHEGPLPDAPDLEPTGKEIEVVGMEFDRIENGRVAETWQMFDLFGMFQQLEILPTEEIPAET